jgi:hypothetical protein
MLTYQQFSSLIRVHNYKLINVITVLPNTTNDTPPLPSRHSFCLLAITEYRRLYGSLTGSSTDQ